MTLDERVRALTRAGDHDGAATEALRALGPGVLGYLASMLPEDDARDAFSCVAEDLWTGLPGFRGECSLRAWTYRLAWHAASRQFRGAWGKRRERLATSMASRIAAEVTSDSGLALGGRRDRLATLREALTPEERTLLVLRVDRELEWPEVAEVLAAEGTPIEAAALRKRFERLKDRLADLARERGLLD